jgi:hypothetical protein
MSSPASNAPATMVDMGQIDHFATRVAEELERRPKNRFLQDLNIDINLSKLTKSNDQIYWSKVRHEFDAFMHETLKQESEKVIPETKESFAAKASKEDFNQFKTKNWADYSSSSDEDLDLIDDLQFLTRNARESNVIRIPYDTEAIWPKGYKILAEACKVYGFVLLADEDVSLERNGFVEAAAFQADKAAAKEYIATRSNDSKLAISGLLSLIYFLKLKPTEWLAKTNEYALTASYALHFLIKGKNAEENDLIKRSLKHSDGGRLLVTQRIYQLFKTGSAAPMLLMAAADRLFRAIAKNYQPEDEDEFKLILNCCFTSKTGIARTFYRQVTRKERVAVEEFKGNKKITTMKEKLVRGLDAPKLWLGNELLKDEENSTLKEIGINFPDEAKFIDEFNQNSRDFLLPAKVCRIVVEKAYAISDRISRTLKKRKEELRVRSLAKVTDRKIPQSIWIAERNQLLKECDPLDSKIYDEIKRFDTVVREAVMEEIHRG